MCQTRRDRAVSIERSRRSPLPRSSSSESESNSAPPTETEKEVKEWEDTRCPVCMEHPHNAVLLICSSYNNGCRPYMCNTSERHSNCFDQYRKSFAKPCLPFPLEGGAPHAHWSDTLPGQTVGTDSQEEGETDAPNNLPGMHKLNQMLACPLCRGHITGWIVVQSARKFMNTKTRSCACETCDFTGHYRDLRRHVRVVHPEVRPTDPDPERENNWRQLERQRDIEDVISNLRSLREDEENGTENRRLFTTVDDESDTDYGFFTTIFLVFEVSRVRIQTLQTSASGGATPVSTFRRSRVRRRAVSDGEEDGLVSSVEDNNETFDSDTQETRRTRTLRWRRAGDRRIRRRLD